MFSQAFTLTLIAAGSALVVKQTEDPVPEAKDADSCSCLSWQAVYRENLVTCWDKKGSGIFAKVEQISCKKWANNVKDSAAKNDFSEDDSSCLPTDKKGSDPWCYTSLECKKGKKAMKGKGGQVRWRSCSADGGDKIADFKKSKQMSR